VTLDKAATVHGDVARLEHVASPSQRAAKRFSCESTLPKVLSIIVRTLEIVADAELVVMSVPPCRA